MRDIGEVLNDPQLAARDMIQVLEHATLGAIKTLGLPIKLSDTPGAPRSAPPTLGQHTDEILSRDLGMTGVEIAALRATAAI